MFYRDSIFSWFKTRTFKDNYFILHISSNGELWKPHSSTLVKYRVSIHELRKSPWWTETHKLSDTCYVLHFSVYLVYIITNDEYQGLCFKVFRAWSIDFYYLANELKNFVAIGNKYGLGCFVLYILGIYQVSYCCHTISLSYLFDKLVLENLLHLTIASSTRQSNTLIWTQANVEEIISLDLNFGENIFQHCLNLVIA
jgi:hypothetical protein